MNLLKFLTGKTGKVSLNSLVGVASVAACAGLGMYANNTANQPVVADRVVFANVNAFEQAKREALENGRDTISFSNEKGIRLGGVEGPSGGADDYEFSSQISGAIGNAYNADNNVAFGTGTQDVDVGRTAPLATDTSNPYGSGVVRAAINGSGANGEGGVGGTNDFSGGNYLPSASMATANGGGSGVNNGAYPGGSSNGGSGNGGRSNGAQPMEGSTLSGSMSSSNDSIGLLASAATNKANFGSGNGARVNGRGNLNGAGGDLVSIAKHTGKVAAKGQDAYSNQGTEAFFGGALEEVGGGLSLGEVPENSTEDLAPLGNNIKKNLKGVKDWSDAQRAYLQKLAKARKHLAIGLLALLAAGVVMGTTMFFLLKAGKKNVASANPITAALGAKLLLAGSIIMFTYLAMCAAAIGNCISFVTHWKGDAGSLPVTGILLSLAAVLGIKTVAAKALSGGINPATNISKLVTGMTKFTGFLSGGFGSVVGTTVTSFGVSGVKDVVAAINNPDAK